MSLKRFDNVMIDEVFVRLVKLGCVGFVDYVSVVNGMVLEFYLYLDLFGFFCSYVLGGYLIESCSS